MIFPSQSPKEVMPAGDFVEMSTVIRNWWSFPAVGFNAILEGMEGMDGTARVSMRNFWLGGQSFFGVRHFFTFFLYGSNWTRHKK